MSTVLLTGRLVSGHPMEDYPVTDMKTNQPKFKPDGVTPRRSVNIGFAIPKAGETDWKQTLWGQVFLQAAQAGWPNGEYNAPTFAWKVVDGDSQIPNKKGNKPCDREGYPGHWIVFASHELGPVRCFHAGKFQPHECIQNKLEIKCGDYGRLNVKVVANNPSQSPGIYINPDMFCLDRPGEPIVSATETNAADVFGGGAAPAPISPPVSGAAPMAPTPAAPVGLTMTAKAGGATYEQFRANNWTDQMMIEQGYAVAPSGVQPNAQFMQPPVT